MIILLTLLVLAVYVGLHILIINYIAPYFKEMKDRRRRRKIAKWTI